jgi:hypothetical protein
MPAAVLLEDILERDWQKAVRKLLRSLGWEAYHTYDSRKSDMLPDIVAVHGSRRHTVYLGLKREKTRLTLAQAKWIELLEQAGNEVYVAAHGTSRLSAPSSCPTAGHLGA